METAVTVQHAAWMVREHNRLDARLASTFLKTVWGSAFEARREFGAYSQELAAHIDEGERRFFSAIAPLDERTRAMERFEWKAHTRDVQQAILAVQRELRRSTVSRYEAFAVLRRALRRHRRHEEHLLQIAGAGRRAPRLTEAFL